MSREITHKLMGTPQMGARYLADWMEASEQRRRTIERECKYASAVRLPQHKEAKIAIAGFFRGNLTLSDLLARADELRHRNVEEGFERDRLDNNADYIERFVSVSSKIQMPKRAEVVVAGPKVALSYNGLKITIDGAFRLQRKSGDGFKIGIATLRYQKGKELDLEIGKWQSALMWGMLDDTDDADKVADRKLALTIDAYSGLTHIAPGDAKDRFNNIKAASQSIAERWPSIQPPSGAVI